MADIKIADLHKIDAKAPLMEELSEEVMRAVMGGAGDGIQNDFAGTGFMFSVGNLIVSGGSRVKLFNQNSDNAADPNSTQ
ncbi:MAG: hypothetical protein RM022_000615 [Nostoc sp. EfeVER01]|uniref:hypothetical protein n=1 Tax=unclassified Nostoc TaxID=2593658 RepID=UPI002AD1E6AF|nr:MULTISPECIES: hypothetical protein [unclassified Nostoc]MDZ7947053.1 hypothetical protein [Nostoc sp. EfeVER01]MDZ7991477.1 hypothetical protein [Nostoc sp. EspVER01]